MIKYITIYQIIFFDIKILLFLFKVARAWRKIFFIMWFRGKRTLVLGFYEFMIEDEEGIGYE